MLPPFYSYPTPYRPTPPYPYRGVQFPVATPQPILPAQQWMPTQAPINNTASPTASAPQPLPATLWNGYYGSSGWQSSPVGIQELNNTFSQWMIESSNKIPWNELVPSITDMGKMGIQALQERMRLRHRLFPEAAEVTPPSGFLLQLLERFR